MGKVILLYERKMKKKIIIGISVAIALIVCIFLLLQINKGGKRPEVFSESCWESVKNYEVVDLGDGTFRVRLIAPDYKEIMKKITEKDEDIRITTEILERFVHENEEMVKEYEYTVDSYEIEVIKEGYINEIGNDLSELILETYERETDEG